MLAQGGAPWLVGGVFILLALLLFHRSLQALCRLLVRTVVGILVLAVFSPVGRLLGISLGVNLWNGLVLGLLGGPGFGLLLMLHLLAPG
ncbi:MAG: transcriptional regulator [Oscillospiraceae bacterium]|nr:transcriptional regulator [Oscillospiraceae bacterium]